jgi:acyl carrier protein
MERAVNVFPFDGVRAQETRRVLAAIVAAKLERSGVPGVSAHALTTDPELGGRDFAALGLNSVDWMDVASEVEDAFDVELPDEVLLDAEHRSVIGWSEHVHHLRRLQAADTTEPTGTHDADACGAKGNRCD